MNPYAQTILQLYSQLERNGYSDADKIFIRNGYKLATLLFAGRYHRSGKIFTAHCVGTASILASLELPVPIVVAGLIHNVYRNGDFGDGTRAISNAKRMHVRNTVGGEVEELVTEFAVLKWNEKTIPLIHSGLGALKPLSRQALLIRLADHLDRYEDLAALYYPDAKRGQKFAKKMGPVIVAIAEELGYRSLAAEFIRVFEETASARIPFEFRSNTDHQYSFVIAPKSYRKRFWILLRQKLQF